MKHWSAFLCLVTVGCGADGEPWGQPSDEVVRVTGALVNQGVYTIRDGGNGNCWDIQGGSTAPGARAMLFPCHSGTNQQFRFTFRGGSYWQIQPVNSNLCLGQGDAPDVPNGNVFSVAQWTCITSQSHRYLQTWAVRRRFAALGDVAWNISSQAHELERVGPISFGVDNHLASGANAGIGSAVFIYDLNGNVQF